MAVFDIAVRDVPGFDQARMAKAAVLLDSVVAMSGLGTVPRSELQARLLEQQKELCRPCYDDACQIEIVKAVAAQKALTTLWARFGTNCPLAARLYDLKTNLADFSAIEKASCDEAVLLEAIEAVGRAVKGRMHAGYGTFTLNNHRGQRVC